MRPESRAKRMRGTRSTTSLRSPCNRRGNAAGPAYRTPTPASRALPPARSADETMATKFKCRANNTRGLQQTPHKARSHPRRNQWPNAFAAPAWHNQSAPTTFFRRRASSRVGAGRWRAPSIACFLCLYRLLRSFFDATLGQIGQLQQHARHRSNSWHTCGSSQRRTVGCRSLFPSNHTPHNTAQLTFSLCATLCLWGTDLPRPQTGSSRQCSTFRSEYEEPRRCTQPFWW